MAGSITLSLSQQFDPSGKPYGGGKVYFIQAGTVATPQNAYQDLGLTLPWPNPYTLLEDGRIPQVYFADGYIKVRITDKTGVEIFNQDNIPVTGPSSGGGGGGGVDPTTVLQTGWLVPIYGTGTITGFVRTNAKTIGNASSGATERAFADTAALFAFLWNADPSLTVSGGRGANAAADYAANKTIALPDFRGRVMAGLDDMGNSAAGRLTTFTMGSGTVLGAIGGFEKWSLALTQLPTGITMSGSNAITVTGPNGHTAWIDATLASIPNTGGALQVPSGGAASNSVQFSGTNTITGTSTNTGAQAHPTQPPTILVTIYMKL